MSSLSAYSNTTRQQALPIVLATNTRKSSESPFTSESPFNDENQICAYAQSKLFSPFLSSANAKTLTLGRASETANAGTSTTRVALLPINFNQPPQLVVFKTNKQETNVKSAASILDSFVKRTGLMGTADKLAKQIDLSIKSLNDDQQSAALQIIEDTLSQIISMIEKRRAIDTKEAVFFVHRADHNMISEYDFYYFANLCHFNLHTKFKALVIEKLSSIFQECSDKTDFNIPSNDQLTSELAALEAAAAAFHLPAEIDAAKLNTDYARTCKIRNANKSLSEQIDLDFNAWNRGKINQCQKSNTLLTLAIDNNNPTIVPWLAKMGVNLDATISSFSTPLTYAIDKNNSDLVAVLCAEGANINMANPSGNTPVIHAIFKQNLKMIEFLSTQGADINAKDPEGLTPLIHAVRFRNPELIRLLATLKADFNTADSAGMTPLIHAIRRKNLSLVKLLIELGGSLDSIDYVGRTPLIHAIENIKNNDLTIIQFLIGLGVDLKFNARDFTGLTALQHAIYRNHQDVIKLLGLNQAQCDQAMHEKFAAHIWGLRGVSEYIGMNGEKHQFMLEGMQPWQCMKTISAYVDTFFDAVKDTQLPDQAKKEIQNAFKNAYPFGSESMTSMLSKITDDKAPQPYIILGGTFHHAISMVLYNGYLTVCNRGVRTAKHTSTIYSLPTDAITTQLLGKLQTTYANIHIFDDMLKSLKLSRVKNECYSQQDQKVGNCTTASAKAALLALCRQYLGDAEGRTLYKQFTAFARRHSLQAYLDDDRLFNRPIIDLVINKVKTKLMKAKAGSAEAKFYERIYRMLTLKRQIQPIGKKISPPNYKIP